MSMLGRFAVCVVVALALGLSSDARAQGTDDERARGHFLAGNSYFQQARYAEAHDQFLEAYELSGRVELLLNASMAAERNLDFEEAIRLLDQFLEVAPPEHQMRNVEAERRTRLVVLRDRAAQTGTTRTQTTTPATTETEAEAGGGGLGTLGWVGVGTAGGGVALGVVSLATGLVANGKYGDLEDDCPGGTCPPGSGGRISSGRTMARLSTGTMFIGAAGLVTGIVLIILDDGPADEASAPAASLRPAVTGGPGEAGLGLRWSF